MTITVYPYDPATAPPVPATASDGTTDALSIAVDIYKFYRIKRTASEVVSNSNGVVNKRYCCIPEEYVSRNLVTNKRARSSSAVHQHHFDDDDAPAMKRARFNNPDETVISHNKENPISPVYFSSSSSSSSSSSVENESSEDEDDFFLAITEEEHEDNESSLAYSFSSNSQKDDNNSYENESEDDFHSASSNSTHLMTCSSQVQDNGGDDGAEEKDSQEDDYGSEENADDEDLSHEVVAEGKEEEYFECVAKCNEEQSETENPPVPSITIEIDGHHDYDHHEDADDNSSREVAVLGGQEEYFECVAESDEASSSNSTYLSTYSSQVYDAKEKDSQEGSYDHEDIDDEDHSSREVVATGGQEEYYDCVSGSEEEHSETQNPPVPSITIEFIAGHHDNQEDSQDKNYDHCNQDNLSFDNTQEQSKCADDDEEDTNESEAENPLVPSLITDIEPALGLDRVFDNLGNVLSMSSFRLRGLPRKNYKE